MLLSPGIHSFPFKLGLPLGLPSTFLGKHGWVQYYCKTALKEAHSGLAHKNQQVFIVMNPIDLNQEPAILAVTMPHLDLDQEHHLPLISATFPLRDRAQAGDDVPDHGPSDLQSEAGQGRVRARGGHQHLGHHRQPEPGHHQADKSKSH